MSRLKNNEHAIIVCDNCGKSFSTSSVKIKLSGLSIDGTYIEASYFRCPHCHRSYPFGIMDAKCAVLQKEFLKQKARWQVNVGRNNDQSVASSQYVSMVAKKKRYMERCKMLSDTYLEHIKRILDVECSENTN